MESIGMVGGILLALCGFPQAYKVYKEKNARGISGLFLLMWWLGEVLTLIYLLKDNIMTGPLFVNYVSNVLCTSVISYYKIKDLRNGDLEIG